MNESRQPKGVPAGGQFAASTHAEPDVTIRYPDGDTGEQLVRATALLAVDEVRWEEQKAQLAVQSEDHTRRRRRTAGVRAAARLLMEFPDAEYVNYTRKADKVALTGIENAHGDTIYTEYDLAGYSEGSNADRRRCLAVYRAMDHLTGKTPPPEHTEQGITVDGENERIHLPAALEDGVAFMEAEELTPQQSSAQRMGAALSHWAETDGDPQTTMRDLLTDLRHHAAAHNLDLGEALDGSYQVFLEEHNDPAFKEGL